MLPQFGTAQGGSVFAHEAENATRIGTVTADTAE